LNEKTIEISGIDPVELYGVNENKLGILRNYFPKLKIVARGDQLKAIGDEHEIATFEQKVELLIEHLLKYNDG